MKSSDGDLNISSFAGPSPVYASDSELGAQSGSYYSERERDRIDHYGEQISQRSRPERDRHRECSLDRWEEQPHSQHHRSDSYRRDSRDVRDIQHGHMQQQHSSHHQRPRESSVSSIHQRDSQMHEHRGERSDRGQSQHRGSIQHEMRGEGRDREGSFGHEPSRHQSSVYQRGLKSGREHRDSRDHGRDTGLLDQQTYEHRSSFDRSSEREHALQSSQRGSSSAGGTGGVDQYSQPQQQHRQSLSHSHGQFYGDSSQQERGHRGGEPQHKLRLQDDNMRDRSERSERGQATYYSDRGLESDGSETSSVISKLSSTTQSEALHRGPSDRRQSSGQRGSQQTSRTLSEFTLQKGQGGPVHPLSSSSRGSSNESSSMSVTMTRDGRESYGPGGRDAGRLGERRDVLGRRAESVEESTRTSSQSVSEAKEGSEEGSLSDTTTANEDKLGMSDRRLPLLSSLYSYSLK